MAVYQRLPAHLFGHKNPEMDALLSGGHRGTSNYSNTSPVPRLRGTGTEKNQKGDRFRGWLQKPIEKKI